MRTTRILNVPIILCLLLFPFLFWSCETDQEEILTSQEGLSLPSQSVVWEASSHQTTRSASGGNPLNQTFETILVDYKEVSKIAPIDPRKFRVRLEVTGLNTTGLNIRKVIAIKYTTLQEGDRTIFLFETATDLSLAGRIGNFTESVVGQNAGQSGSGVDCEIITNVCDLEDCTGFCVVSNSCDPSGESDPDCCTDVSCDGEGSTGGQVFETLDDLIN